MNPCDNTQSGSTYCRGRERAVALEILTLATLPPDLGNVPSTNLEDATISVGTVRMGDGKDKGRNELRLELNMSVRA